MALDADQLKELIKTKSEALLGVDVENDKGLQALAEAIVEHIQSNAVAIIDGKSGTVQ